jgi:hypothetical protein
MLVAMWAMDCFLDFEAGTEMREGHHTYAMSVSGGSLTLWYFACAEDDLNILSSPLNVRQHELALEMPWFEIANESVRNDPDYCVQGLEFDFYQVGVPLWSLLLIIGAPTCFGVWRNRRRIPPGHCRTCGYNLTGNVSGACPECGERIQDRAAG